MRKNLVFCSVASLSHCTPELFGKDREFDIALHYFAGNNPHVPLKDGELLLWHDGAIHYRDHGVEKLVAASRMIPRLKVEYDAYAFLDADLEISTAQINQCFQVGAAFKLDLWQPALSLDSICGWEFLRQHPITDASPTYLFPRHAPMVEIMMPFFSRKGLSACLPTFDFNYSGWGTDVYQWPKLAEPHVIDWIVVGHHKEATRRQRKLANGLTPYQEFWIAQWIFADLEMAPPSWTPPAPDCDLMKIQI
jgi:hypothetical protein